MTEERKMSISLMMACRDCREKLPIGQVPNGRIYTDEPETMQQLARFLLKHAEHALIFAQEHWFEELHADTGIRYVRFF